MPVENYNMNNLMLILEITNDLPSAASISEVAD